MVIIYIIVLLAAFLVGYLLAWLAREELVPGRKWFILLAVSSLIGAVVVSLIDFSFKFPSVLTLFFLIIISLMAVWKSYDQKWTK